MAIVRRYWLAVPQMVDAPDNGVYLHGLTLEGANWSRKDSKVVDTTPYKVQIRALAAQSVRVRHWNTGLALGYVRCAGCSSFLDSDRSGLCFV